MMAIAKENCQPALLGGEPIRPAGPPTWPPARPEIRQALQSAWANGSWGKYHGPHLERLRVSLAEFHGIEFAEPCCSGTAAIELALRALKVGSGDEVILAGYDFKGNFLDIHVVGAKPVLVDLDPENWNLDPELLEAAIGPKTKALIISHLHGGVVSMRRVMAIAQSHRIEVIEDACQMPGAWIEGKRAGTWGDVGVLSFGGSKLLCAGRGGALLTNSSKIIQRYRLHTERGNHAYPLSELQAAVLIPQLASLDADNAHRTKNVELFQKNLTQEPGLRIFHSSLKETSPGYYKLGFQYDPEAFGGLSREEFIEAIRAEGIAIDAGFGALHKIHSRRRYRSVGDMEQSTRADEHVLVLHHPVLLGQENDVLQIVEAVQKIRRYADDLRTFFSKNVADRPERKRIESFE